MDNILYMNALDARAMYRAGIITREEAKEKIKPYAEFYNEKCSQIAKKYNQRAKKFNFSSFMR